MRTFKSVFGVMGALVPILYCGGLAYYFFDVGGSVKEVADIGLGPTVLGLGLVGLIFCIPLILKIARLFSGPRSPGSGNRPDSDEDESGFDADAAIARYMASRSAESAAPSAPIVSPARGGGFGSAGPAVRQGFGRKVR